MQENKPYAEKSGVQDIPGVRVAVGVGPGARLEDRLRGMVRAMGYALTTDETYAGWYRRYVLYCGKRHPAELGARDVEQFLTHLAAERRVSSTTQKLIASHPLCDTTLRAEKGADMSPAMTSQSATCSSLFNLQFPL